MCTYIHICTHICIYICDIMCTYIHIYIYIYAYIHMYCPLCLPLAPLQRAYIILCPVIFQSFTGLINWAKLGNLGKWV